MAKKKYIKKSIQSSQLADSLAVYRNTGIQFSTLETQGDILLIANLDKKPKELLRMLLELNKYAYKNVNAEKLVFKNAPLIFSSYEYIP